MINALQKALEWYYGEKDSEPLFAFVTSLHFFNLVVILNE